jgi:hypothetical protein
VSFVHVEMGVQYAVPLWCQSCFWMVVMVAVDEGTVLIKQLMWWEQGRGKVEIRTSHC